MYPKWMNLWTIVTSILVGITLLLFVQGSSLAGWWSLSVTFAFDGIASVLASRNQIGDIKTGLEVMGIIMILLSIIYPLLEISRVYNF